MKTAFLVGLILAAQSSLAGTLSIESGGKQTRFKNVYFQLGNSPRTGNKPVLEVSARDESGSIHTCTVNAASARLIDSSLGQIANILTTKNGGLLCRMGEDADIASSIVLFFDRD